MPEISDKGATSDFSQGWDTLRSGVQRLVKWAISLQASDLRSPCKRHGQNQSRHLFRLIQLDEVSSTRDEEELRLRKELMERPGDAAIQRIIGVAEDNPDRALELPQPGDLCGVRPDHGQEVFVQAKEGRAGTRRGLELLIQQRHELTSDIRVSDEPPHLPPVHPAEDPIPE